MTDKIIKALSKMPHRVLVNVKQTLEQIKDHDLEGLDVKSLKGHKDIFRVRVGSYRIIFRYQKDKSIEIVSIAKRNEKTYKDL
jgi:mRNA interferase RelE/StbE